MDALLAICAGVALAAACGFRVFLPLLGLSVGVASGALKPGAGMAWVGSTPALIVLGVAMHPAVKWAAALVAGGGAAGVIQAGTVSARAVSGATTGTLGNPVVATVENVFSAVLSILAILVPVIAALVVI